VFGNGVVDAEPEGERTNAVRKTAMAYVAAGGAATCALLLGTGPAVQAATGTATPSAVRSLRSAAPQLDHESARGRLPSQDGDDNTRCTNHVLNVGELCILAADDGYYASFDSDIDDPSVDFTLWTGDLGPIGDQGAFPVHRRDGQIHTYFFAVGKRTSAHVCLYSRDFKFSPLCTPELPY